MKRTAIFACSKCAAATVILADSPDISVEDGNVEPLGFCGLVRETHAPCSGTVEFLGVVSLGGGLEGKGGA